MAARQDATSPTDEFNLQRFVSAQEHVYTGVLAELRGGRKKTHWMWFVFPQLEGLGHSLTARFYGIKSAAEAQQYLSHQVLGPRLIECTQTVLAVQGRSAFEVFSSPDDLKLKSSMTLFAAIEPSQSVFADVLTKYFNGQHDQKTLDLLGKP